MTTAKPDTVDAYIAGFPKETQKILEQIRATVKKAAPDAKETISYGMPAFKTNEAPLVYFAAFKSHVGLYPAPVDLDELKEDLAAYKTGKSSVQFPLDKPMPLDLITKIVKIRARRNAAKKAD